MSGGPFDPLTFFNALETFQDSGEKVAADKNPRMATVDPAYAGAGNPKLQFDGEASLTVKTYPYINTPPPAGSRVVLMPVGMGWVIMGALSQPAPPPPVVIPALPRVIARSRRTVNAGEWTTNGPHKVTEIRGNVFAGRIYRLSVNNIGFYTSQENGALRGILSRTLDGSVPNLGNEFLWIQKDTLAAGRVVSGSGALSFAPALDYDLRMLFSVERTIGAQAWGLFQTVYWGLELLIEDIGAGPVELSGTQF